MSPSTAAGLYLQFPPWICLEIDKGLAQYVRWYEGRMEATEKSGKYKTRPKFKTLADVLGINEQKARGGMSGADLKDVSGDYKQAVIAAARQGLPAPDINEFLAKRNQPLES